MKILKAIYRWGAARSWAQIALAMLLAITGNHLLDDGQFWIPIYLILMSWLVLFEDHCDGK